MASVAQKIRDALRLGSALRLVWQSAPGWTVASLALIAVRGPLPLLSLYLMKLAVNTITAGFATSDPGRVFEEVTILLVLMGAVSLFSTLFDAVAKLVTEAQTQVVTDHVYTILHAKSLEVDLEYYENPQYYDTLHRAQQEAPFRPTSVLNGLVRLGQSGIVALAITGLLLSFHWGMIAILLVAVVPEIVVRLRYAGTMYRWQREQTSTERRAWYVNWMLTGDQHAKEIRLFDLGGLFMSRFQNLRKQLRRGRLRIAAKRSVAELLAQVATTLIVFGFYAFVAYRTVQGAMTLGDLAMYYQAFRRGQGALQGILSSLAELYEDNLFLAHLDEFLNVKQKIVEPVSPKPIPRPLQTAIVFDHVRFRYPNGTEEVLTDINLSIRPGQKVALVGENGVGKTTLIKLLCRLYDPTGGTIIVDGIDLREFGTTAWRQEIGVIFQDYVRYNLSVRENIWLGNIRLDPEDDRIVQAARRAGADGFVSKLPQGYDTVLGKRFEGGHELSVGEWQKIALARAFLRDTQLLVLDEPTSAMDANTEYELFCQFNRLIEDRAAILISHRFSTVRMADYIYVLAGGRIIEHGSHDELMRLGGTYAQMFERQAWQYRSAKTSLQAGAVGL